MIARGISIVCRWVKACAASQARCKIKGDLEFKNIRPGGSATSLGHLLFGSLPTGALFFYWLNVTAYLLTGNKEPAVLQVNKKTPEQKILLWGLDTGAGLWYGS